MLKRLFENPWIQAAGVLVVLAATYLLWLLLKPVLVSLLLAFIVAYVFDPVVDFFQARKIPRPATIAGLAFLGILLLLAIPLFVVPGVIDQADQLIHAASEGSSNAVLAKWVDGLLGRLPLNQLVRDLGWVDPDAQDVDARAVLAEHIGTYIKENALQVLRGYAPQLATAGQWAGATAAQLFMSLGRGTIRLIVFLGNFAIFVFMAGYLLNDFDKVVASARGLVPHKYREKTFDIFGKIDHQLRSFLQGQILVCICLGVMYAIGLSISGVPFAIPLALFGAFASLVPYMGVVVTIGPALVLVLLQHWIDWHVVGALLTFVVAQGFEGTVITPKIVGDKVGLHPVWVILAIIVFGSALGFLGMLLAIPIAATLKVFVVEGLTHYRESAFFEAEASDDATPPEDTS